GEYVHLMCDSVLESQMVSKHYLQLALQAPRWLETQFPEVIVIDVVMMILLFDARIFDRPDLYLKAEAVSRPAHMFREPPDAIDIVQLVEDPIVPRVRWVLD